MNRPLPLKGKVYECFSLYRRFVNRPYKHLKLPAKPKFEILSKKSKNHREFFRRRDN